MKMIHVNGLRIRQDQILMYEPYETMDFVVEEGEDGQKKSTQKTFYMVDLETAQGGKVTVGFDQDQKKQTEMIEKLDSFFSSEFT